MTTQAPRAYLSNSDFTSGLYDDGGFLFGLTPSLVFRLDTQSSLTLTTGYDFVVHQNADSTHGLNVDYSYWTVGATYGVKL